MVGIGLTLVSTAVLSVFVPRVLRAIYVTVGVLNPYISSALLEQLDDVMAGRSRTDRLNECVILILQFPRDLLSEWLAQRASPDIGTPPNLKTLTDRWVARIVRPVFGPLVHDRFDPGDFILAVSIAFFAFVVGTVVEGSVLAGLSIGLVAFWLALSVRTATWLVIVVRRRAKLVGRSRMLSELTPYLRQLVMSGGIIVALVIALPSTWWSLLLFALIPALTDAVILRFDRVLLRVVRHVSNRRQLAP